METVKEKVNEDNAKAFDRIKLTDNYLKLKNNVESYVFYIENEFINAKTPEYRNFLSEIKESIFFRNLKNRSK